MGKNLLEWAEATPNSALLQFAAQPPRLHAELDSKQSTLSSLNFGQYLEGLLSSVGMENEINRNFNSAQAQIARDFSSAEAEKQRSWEAEMSNTAYQRAAADLRAAGFNPILAAQGGASTPSGAVATGSSASYNTGGGDTLSSILNAVANLVSSAGSLINPLAKLGVKSTTVKGFRG